MRKRIKTDPVAILEVKKMSPLGEFVSAYTLVENPVKGIYRDITLDEARKIIIEKNLYRFDIKAKHGEIEGSLGAVWDTAKQDFERRFSVRGTPGRIRRHFGLVRGKDAEQGKRVSQFLSRARAAYKDFLFRRIDKMFNEEDYEYQGNDC